MLSFDEPKTTECDQPQVELSKLKNGNVGKFDALISPHRPQTPACQSGRRQYPLLQPNAAKSDFLNFYKVWWNDLEVRLHLWTATIKINASCMTCNQLGTASKVMNLKMWMSTQRDRWMEDLIGSKLDNGWTICGVGGELSQSCL